eukprot:scaffold22148_cov64-Phaeocystis_antarctica.AAC.2
MPAELAVPAAAAVRSCSRASSARSGGGARCEGTSRSKVAMTAAWSEESRESHEMYEAWRSRAACSVAECHSTRSQYDGTRFSFERGREERRSLGEAVEESRAHRRAQLVGLQQRGPLAPLDACEHLGVVGGVLLGQRSLEGGVALQSVVEVAEQEEVVHLGLQVGGAHPKPQPGQQLAQVLVPPREVVGVRRQVRAHEAQARRPHPQRAADRALVAVEAEQTGAVRLQPRQPRAWRERVSHGDKHADVPQRAGPRCARTRSNQSAPPLSLLYPHSCTDTTTTSKPSEGGGSQPSIRAGGARLPRFHVPTQTRSAAAAVGEPDSGPAPAAAPAPAAPAADAQAGLLACAETSASPPRAASPRAAKVPWSERGASECSRLVSASEAPRGPVAPCARFCAPAARAAARARRRTRSGLVTGPCLGEHRPGVRGRLRVARQVAPQPWRELQRDVRHVEQQEGEHEGEQLGQLAPPRRAERRRLRRLPARHLEGDEPEQYEQRADAKAERREEEEDARRHVLLADPAHAELAHPDGAGPPQPRGGEQRDAPAHGVGEGLKAPGDAQPGVHHEVDVEQADDGPQHGGEVRELLEQRLRRAPLARQQPHRQPDENRECKARREPKPEGARATSDRQREHAARERDPDGAHHERQSRSLIADSSHGFKLGLGDSGFNACESRGGSTPSRRSNGYRTSTRTIAAGARAVVACDRTSLHLPRLFFWPMPAAVLFR